MTALLTRVAGCTINLTTLEVTGVPELRQWSMML